MADKRGKIIIPGAVESNAGGGILSTNYNRPFDSSICLVCSLSHVELYQKEVDRNPNYFLDQEIRIVVVLSDEDYGNLIRKKMKLLKMCSWKEYEKEQELLGITPLQQYTLPSGIILPNNKLIN